MSLHGSAPAAAASPSAAAAIQLRMPSKYQKTATATATKSAAAPFAAPPLDWLARTWSVTHSTLRMWRSAQNVRIRYRPLPDDARGRPRNEDRVEYEAANTGGAAAGAARKVKSVEGVNVAGTASTAAGTAASDGTFDWRGKGWLCFVTSHWEILGWGERPLPAAADGDGNNNGGDAADAAVERWAVTWFAPTLFTREGIDIYCDRRAGLSADTAAALLAALQHNADWPPPLAALAQELRPVDIRLPWAE